MQSANASFWTVGGYFVGKGFSGYLAKLNVYQLTLLDFQQFAKHYLSKDKQELQKFVPESFYSKCTAYHDMVNGILGPDHNGQPKQSSWRNAFFKTKSNTRQLSEHAFLSEDVEELKQKLTTVFGQSSEDTKNGIGSTLHVAVMKNLVGFVSILINS